MPTYDPPADGANIKQSEGQKVTERTMDYRTGSLPLAAFLAARGAQFLRCEVAVVGRCDFIFADPNQNLNEIEACYYNSAPASARQFYKLLLDLKRLAQQTIRGGAQ